MEISLFFTGAVLYLIADLSTKALDNNIDLYVIVDEFKNKLMRWIRIKQTILKWITISNKNTLKNKYKNKYKTKCNLIVYHM